MLRSRFGIGRRLLELHRLLVFRMLRLLQLLLCAGFCLPQRSKLTAHARVVFGLLKQICGTRQPAACSLGFLGPLPFRVTPHTLVSSLGSFARSSGTLRLPFGLAQLGSIATHRVLTLLLQRLQRILTHGASLAHFQYRVDFSPPTCYPALAAVGLLHCAYCTALTAPSPVRVQLDVDSLATARDRECHSCTLRTCGAACPLCDQISSASTAATAADIVVKYGTLLSSALRRIE